MQRKQIIKDIIAFLILISIIPLLCLTKHMGFMQNKIIFGIFIFISFLIIMGFYSYVCFKIMRGTVIIYKDPNKEKTLNNIDFYESLPTGNNISRFRKSIKYSEELPLRKNYFLRKFVFLFGFTVLAVIIVFLISIFHPTINQNPIFNKINYILIRFSAIIVFLAMTYYKCETVACLWCYYVKLFQLLGLFRFLEKDFNKTINSHKYFPISIMYEKSKEKTPKPKSIKKD
ncbi:hypothetical protein [Candidatus Phytoplasma pyri]|uniref:hypothetical protein n=1 Tax=Candidatus Phytoplasma pyri TaxID=47566 RepID=UPI003982FD18